MEFDFGLLTRQTRLILDSYRRWTGQSLWPEAEDPETGARKLFEAPWVVASSGAAADPVLNYGNRMALELWEMSWEEFTRTPGRCTAEPMERALRQDFLDRVARDGIIKDYEGVRISKTGRRFRIEKAVVWNLCDADGRFQGQAASFKEWTYL